MTGEKRGWGRAKAEKSDVRRKRVVGELMKRRMKQMLGGRLRERVRRDNGRMKGEEERKCGRRKLEKNQTA